LAELEAKKLSLSPGAYLKEMSKFAADVSELGGRRTARRLLGSAYDSGQAELSPGERLEITVQLVNLLRQEDDTRGAVNALKQLVPLAEALPDTDPKKLSFWKEWASSLAEELAYSDAIAAFNRAIELSTNKKERDGLRAELAELYLLSGNIDEALKISAEDSASD
jgi:tetratricopeptide (TPR) repeat protein